MSIWMFCVYKKRVGFEYNELKGHLKSSAELFDTSIYKLISASGIALIPLTTFPFGYVQLMAFKFNSAFGSGSVGLLLC